MKLEQDRIVIEERGEIGVLQDMIFQYLAEKPSSTYADDLRLLDNKLDLLWLNW